jgi:hypothetical protein
MRRLSLVKFITCLLIGSSVFFVFSGTLISSGSQDELKIEWILPPKYHEINVFREGRAWVQEDEGGPWSLLDEDGGVVKSGVNVKRVYAYESGVALFLQDSDHFGFFDISGDVVSFFNDRLRSGYGERLRAKSGENGLYGFVDIYGKWVIAPAFQEVRSFSNGMSVVGKDGKYGYIDRSGDVVIDYKFNYASHFEHELAVVEINSKFGVIDKKGNWVAEPIYEAYAHPWTDPVGLQKDGKFGFIDSEGDIAIDFKFDGIPSFKGGILNAYCFSEDRAVVVLNKENWVIDKSGEVLFRIETEIGHLRPYINGYLQIYKKKDDSTILIDKDGREHSLPGDLSSPRMMIHGLGDSLYQAVDLESRKKGFFKIIN